MVPKLFLPILLALLLTACGVNVTFDMDQETATIAAAEIAEFDLPAGFNPEFSASLDTYTLVAYTRGDGPSHLYLVQSQQDNDAEKMIQTLDHLVPGEKDSKKRTTVLEIRPISVKGQETTLIITEGTNSSGQVYRQATIFFQGKGGPSLLAFSEPISAWNLVTVDALLNSIR